MYDQNEPEPKMWMVFLILGAVVLIFGNLLFI